MKNYLKWAAIATTIILQTNHLVAASGSKPITLEVDGIKYEEVTLSSVEGSNVGITHSTGVASIALQKLTKEQVAALNTTSTTIQIDVDVLNKKQQKTEFNPSAEGSPLSTNKKYDSKDAAARSKRGIALLEDPEIKDAVSQYSARFNKMSRVVGDRRGSDAVGVSPQMIAGIFVRAKAMAEVGKKSGRASMSDQTQNMIGLATEAVSAKGSDAGLQIMALASWLAGMTDSMAASIKLPDGETFLDLKNGQLQDIVASGDPEVEEKLLEALAKINSTGFNYDAFRKHAFFGGLELEKQSSSLLGDSAAGFALQHGGDVRKFLASGASTFDGSDPALLKKINSSKGGMVEFLSTFSTDDLSDPKAVKSRLKDYGIENDAFALNFSMQLEALAGRVFNDTDGIAHEFGESGDSLRVSFNATMKQVTSLTEQMMKQASEVSQ